MAKAQRESVIALREHAKCGFVACICPVLKHAPTCAFRVAIIGPFPPGGPQECATHLVFGACKCRKCDCGKGVAA